MKKAFKNFWKEYFDLCKASGVWLKKHWLGYIILCVVIFFVTFGTSFVQMKWCDRKLEKAAHDLDQEED